MPTPTAPDFDALLAETVPTGGPTKVPAILAALDPEQRKKVERAGRDPGISHERIADALVAMGHKVSEGAVRNWRKTLR